jgi:hypothetical protein
MLSFSKPPNAMKRAKASLLRTPKGAIPQLCVKGRCELCVRASFCQPSTGKGPCVQNWCLPHLTMGAGRRMKLRECFANPLKRLPSTPLRYYMARNMRIEESDNHFEDL